MTNYTIYGIIAIQFIYILLLHVRLKYIKDTTEYTISKQEKQINRLNLKLHLKNKLVQSLKNTDE